MSSTDPALAGFQGPVRAWFEESFERPTPAQVKGFGPIVRGGSTLLLAPTGSGKTLAAFLTALDRMMFSREPARSERLKVVYVSPLKALGVDIERNLRAPIAGIAAVAERQGVSYRVPSVAVRSGDTPARERAQFARAPADILITTPESLYLLLTSNARQLFSHVETLIVDEIHSLVATKRGAHLFLSLERLEAERTIEAPLQRIGLSATQRPLEEVARLLGGGVVDEAGIFRPRPVEIVDAGSKRSLELSVQVPVEDMSRLGEPEELSSGPAAAAPRRASIWPSIHPRLLELIRAHRSTMIFANSRRLAERLAAALNELAGEEIALAHHGSVARDRRALIEDRLKSGDLPAIVATSSLELGIDMGAVDLVVQIEAPPSVASGMQRIGRAGHSVGAVSRGVIFPKYRGDLLACAAVTARMFEGKVEETFYPRNPLDVLAQQVVARVALGPIAVDDLYRLVRQAAPFADLPRGSFESVLDMLSGRYPSDEFAELRARVTWDRVDGVLHAREGARRIAVINGGTIPDRGLYGVFLAGTESSKKSVRVGELDEEMVFESRTGDVFLLGASSWRIEDITHDRVLVSPAPGEPGKMPFWHGDRPGRPPELGRAIGELTRQLTREPAKRAEQRLVTEHALDANAARNLLQYLQEQTAASGDVPSDRNIVIERFVDEMGDQRVCVLTPFGARVHAPWATAVVAALQADMAAEVETLWSDDGMVFRLPAGDELARPELFLPDPDEVEDRVVQSLGGTSLFAARFRENAARALLLPRRYPGKRSPLWAQRKRAADLLAVAARYGSFPILLETYRECLRDVFDLPALIDILRQVRSRELRVLTVDSQKPSPFAASLLFSYVANFIYEGDAPLAERRAQALSVNQAELRELLGAAELRELLDRDAIHELERTLQRREFPLKSADAVHDLLLHVGDLSQSELLQRCEHAEQLTPWIDELTRARRVIAFSVAGTTRHAAAEDAGRFRDALGVVPARGLPSAFLEPAPHALDDLVSRYARTHGPFASAAVAERFGLGVAPIQAALERLLQRERVVAGEFLPGGRGGEWCDANVLRILKQRSLARLRKQVEPVEAPVFCRFLLSWQHVTQPLPGMDGLISAIEQLQGAPLIASELESEILPARVRGYRPSDLDALCASGEVVWRGVEALGSNDGRISLYLADQYARLAPPAREPTDPLEQRVVELLERRGALFFSDIVAETGAFLGDVLEALWNLVWAGQVRNDTLSPLRSRRESQSKRDTQRVRGRLVRGRRLGPPGSEGRWALTPRHAAPAGDVTARIAAQAQALLERYGVLTREAVNAEGLSGGFSVVYPVLKAMEEAGKLRRGYFVAGLGATQFAHAGAEDHLRALREPRDSARSAVLSASDPANPYGAALPWPKSDSRPARSAGAHVILNDGRLLGYLGRSDRSLLTFVSDAEPERGEDLTALARALGELVEGGRRRALLIGEIDGEPAQQSPLAEKLVAAGFSPSSRGFLKRARLSEKAG